MKTTITDFAIIVIVIVWAITVWRNMYDTTYPIPVTVQVAIGAVAAFLFGGKILKGGPK